VRKRAQASFDPKKFLAKVGDGKAILNYLKNQIVFSQGEVADAVFYIQEARSSSSSFPSTARKQLSLS
jgi:CRP/FNR family cyclic AMP-dependent transcriptional regulator